MKIEPLGKAERAALAALAWRDEWHRQIARGSHPVQVRDELLLSALDEIYEEPAWAEPAEEPVWVLRTMKDVRQGDIVRLPAAPDRVAKVLFALSLDWHAKQGTRSWVWKGGTYWDDTPLEHTLISMRMDYEGVQLDAEGLPALLQLPPDVPVEISLTPTELAAIEALGGWGNRVRMESETS